MNTFKPGDKVYHEVDHSYRDSPGVVLRVYHVPGNGDYVEVDWSTQGKPIQFHPSSRLFLALTGLDLMLDLL